MTRWMPFVFACLVGALVGQSSESSPAVNLLDNPSFEALDGVGGPIGWTQSTWSGLPVFSVEGLAGFARTGRRCLKVSSTEGADASWSFKVGVRPHTRYRLSAWVRTRGLDRRSGRGAQLNLHELQMDGMTPAISGDNGWTRLESTFDSGDHDSLLVNLLFGGWGRSVGEAWFDDVRLEDLSPPVPVMSPADKAAFYREKVHPILSARCYECHGPDSELEGGLFLGSREGVLRGGEGGAAVVLDQARESHLLSAIRYETYRMPPSGKLPDPEREVLEASVQLGAPWDPGLETERPHVETKGTPQVNAETMSHWSFVPPVRPEVPVPSGGPMDNPIDAFVAVRREAAGLAGAGPARREELCRRAYYDLLGLPPSPHEIREFVGDPRPDAWERLIDRILASPHYGERWGRHWLDLVRYAESNSFERDGAKPFVWRYRDYVIDAFNRDKPMDQFFVEQLAGDELEDVTAEGVIATGYYRLGQWDDEPADRKQALYDDLDDIVTTTAQTFLGLTINCARCHDHKLDPIPQKDYYRFLAFFRNVRRYGKRAHNTVVDASVRVIATEEEKARREDQVKAHREGIAELEAGMRSIEEEVKKDFAPVEHEEFKHERNRVALVKKRAGKVIPPALAQRYEELFRERGKRRRNPPAALAQALCVKEHGATAPKTQVMIRGNPHVPGDEVEPGFPRVLSPPAPEISRPASGKSTGRRATLARWIASSDNPLTARVLVNRVWQHHLGAGIVRSPNDFGLQGRPPSHPELLDWLATELVSGGWRLKRIHRLIMTSETYRMSTTVSDQARIKDPANHLLTRFPLRRLSAEEIRDSVLKVSGNFNPAMHGPSIFPVIEREVLAGQSRPGDGWRVSPPSERTRRSVYVHVKRSMVLPLLSSFDFADTDMTCPVRFQTTQPTQSLTLLNSAFISRQSRLFARDLVRRTPGDLGSQVEAALWRVTQRSPRPGEVGRGVRLVRTLQREESLSREHALAAFCRVALNLNEFLYVN